MSIKNTIKLCLFGTIFCGKIISLSFCADVGTDTDWPVTIIINPGTASSVTISPRFLDDRIPAQILGTGTKLRKLELIEGMLNKLLEDPTDIALRILIALTIYNSQHELDRYQVFTSKSVDITKGIKGIMIGFGNKRNEIVAQLKDITPKPTQTPEARKLLEMIDEMMAT